MAQGFSKQPTADPFIEHAQNVIFSTYGQNASVAAKKKDLNKFGRNTAASTTSSTVWTQGGNETYISTNAINSISSSSGSDTGTVVIEGHTISGSNLTFVTQTATLSGQTRVALTTPLVRANRVYNTGTTNFAGNIYAYQNTAISGGVPTDATKIHLKALLGNDNSSLKCATAMSSVDYWLINSFSVSVLKKTSGFAEFSLQIREFGKVFRTFNTLSASSTSGTILRPLEPYLIAPPNSDIRVICTADASNTDVSAAVRGTLATVI